MAATRTALAPVPAPRRAPAPRGRGDVDPDAPTRPQLRVVPPRRPTGPIVAVALVLVFGVLLATAALNTMLVSGQRELDRIEADIREGERRNQALELEVAELESPARISEAAVDIGMEIPDEVIWLTPRPDGGSDSMTTPTAGSGDVRADEGVGGPSSDDATTDDASSDDATTDDATTDDGTTDEVAAGSVGGSGG